MYHFGSEKSQETAGIVEGDEGGGTKHETGGECYQGTFTCIGGPESTRSRCDTILSPHALIETSKHSYPRGAKASTIEGQNKQRGRLEGSVPLQAARAATVEGESAMPRLRADPCCMILFLGDILFPPLGDIPPPPGRHAPLGYGWDTSEILPGRGGRGGGAERIHITH